MNADRIKYLMERFRNDQCSEAELDELNDWYHSLKGASQDFEKWLEDVGGEDRLKEQLYGRFLTRIEKGDKPGQKYLWYKVAAVLCVFVTVGYLLFHSPDKTVKPIAFHVKKSNPIIPGKDQAVLTLADGRKVVLDGTADGRLADEQGVQISKVDGGKLVYNANDAAGNAATLWNTIDIPRAGQYQLVLPDGTKVWLNSDTHLRFPMKFTGSERKVTLTGEAYFEVAHNAKMPFRVESGEQTITVLGTHFNVKAYTDEQVMSTTLLEGKVRIDNSLSHQTRLLSPGLQASIVKNKGEIAVSSAPVDEVMAWKNGYFVFDNEDIRSIMKIVSRWYDVDVSFKLDKTIRLGGTFSKSSNLEQLLKNFSLISDARFELKERRIIVSN